MHNPAPTEHPVHEVIQNRWSPRAFGDQSIPGSVLRSLFEAARWAPSSSNQQPWAYIVATKDDRENFDKILSVLVPFNAGWAKEASALAIAVAELKFTNGNPNRNAYYDVGAASLQLSIEATARGLVVHQMAGYDPEKARQVFDIPADWDAIAAMAIGYPGDPTSLPAPLKEREVAPRSRKPLSSFVMTGKWGHTAPFISK
ncbi:MAG TPA: nitroreductase family protein [Candidatus Saccharimonadales bacterium]|nr:nitroreductase family protein [Candidatus Saccharimonadales bacterium]